MKFKKLFKAIIYIPILIIVFGLLYVLLIMGENDEAMSGATFHNPKNQQCRNLNLDNAQFDEILNEFGTAMLVKNSLPTKLDLQCKGNKNNYLYHLDAEYSTNDGANYSISAYSPMISKDSLDLKNYSLIADKNITVGGMHALWFESANDIKICLNNENANYVVSFPKIRDEEIIAELNTLSLSK